MRQSNDYKNEKRGNSIKFLGYFHYLNNVWNILTFHKYLLNAHIEQVLLLLSIILKYGLKALCVIPAHSAVLGWTRSCKLVNRSVYTWSGGVNTAMHKQAAFVNVNEAHCNVNLSYTRACTWKKLRCYFIYYNVHTYILILEIVYSISIILILFYLIKFQFCMLKDGKTICLEIDMLGISCV